ncbi:hypothetical protein D3C81_1157300 [compost metagenome]
MQADHQVHVLADRIHLVAADGDHALLVEHTECAGDDQQCIHRRPAHAPEQERAQVFHQLEAGQQAVRQADLGQHAIRDRAAVEHAHHAATGNHAAILKERPHHARQAFRLQDAVGIHHAEQRIACAVDACIDRIGLATVVLVHHVHAREARRCIDALNRLGRQSRAIRLGHFHQAECLDQRLARGITGAVVDHHDLELGVAGAQQRAHRGHHRAGLVVGRQDDADRRLVIAQCRRQVVGAVLAHVAHDLVRGDVIEDQIGEVDRHEIGHEEPLHRRRDLDPRHLLQVLDQHLPIPAHAMLLSPCSARTWSMMSRP